MQGGWQPPPGGGSGYGGPPGGGPPGYGQPPPGGAPPGYGAQPGGYAPNPYAQPGAPPGMMGGQTFGNYEFNDTENAIIDKAAGRAKLWGIISTVIGALQCLGTCGAIANPGMAIYLPLGIVGIIVGLTFIGVGNALKNVVNTQGNDIAHMMQAVQKMGSAFLIQTIVTLVGIVLLALVMVLAMFVFVAAAASS